MRSISNIMQRHFDFTAPVKSQLVIDDGAFVRANSTPS